MGKHSNYVIQPRGKALYEDETSFGSRMLAKMGWTKGKGLGANENGAQDFIRVKYKNDIGGLGFSARDDQWTENEFTFNSLLDNLNKENGQTGQNGDKDTDNKDDESERKIKSLEEKSKKSRSRVHYQKFTRGKDLSRYSEKDLANIFGKKSLSDSYKVEKEDESSSGSLEEKQEMVEDSKMIHTGVSIADYFKSKRQNLAMKNGEVNGNAEIKETETVEPEVVEPEEVPKKKKKKSKKKDEEQDESNTGMNEAHVTETQKEQSVEECEVVPEEVPEKKKKSKKSKRKEESDETEQTEITQNEPESEEPPTKKKKKKKNSPKNSSEEETVPEQPITNSKKRRISETNDSTEVQETKKSKKDSDPSTKTTITVGSDPNKFFLDAVAVEKLKYLRLERFKDSNVANIVGYGLSKDIKLEVCDSSIIKGISHVNKYSIYANVDKMHSKKYYKSLFLRYHKKRNTFKL